MGKSIDEKMESFYLRFNIKKEMNEKDTYALLRTRVSDSIQLFIRYFEKENDTFDLEEEIKLWLSDHYGESLFEEYDIYYYIDETKSTEELLEFMQFFIAYLESNKTIKNKTLQYIVSLFKLDTEKCQLDIDIIKSKDGYILIPSGAKVLDEKLVNDNLVWLANYENAYKEYDAALKAYMERKDIRFIADSLRLCLELFLKQFFEKECGIDKIKPLYREYLEKQGVALEIRNMFETLLSYYLNYNDVNVKHNNKVYKQEVEFLLYQTGIFLRMFITLKNGS